jgi:hypothetical protein
MTVVYARLDDLPVALKFDAPDARTVVTAIGRWAVDGMIRHFGSEETLSVHFGRVAYWAVGVAEPPIGTRIVDASLG